MAEPLSVIAGDTWTWIRSSGSDFPATDGWVLTYYFSQGAEAPKVVEAVVSGSDFCLVVAASTTRDWPAGTWRWFARVAKGEEFHVLARGILQVVPDPSASVDRRSKAEKGLAAVEAVLAKRLGDSIVEYEIDGVKAKHRSHDELVLLRDRFRTEIALERRRPILSRIRLGRF